ncbi:LysR family transcriptional regulator [Vagococcus entomophilus]|uniref:HTH lysR-type domain-containing protein n=1 Tax=Vagococcus entomophilus TaxID=1160095 RepID=A0A430AGV4_9ENTE|nr:LysR family transcriptional regulator [Vagococcus entomophilus]RSU07084.1 hypothetical protein CBF30_07455 [Vagococcus entomophilus]
MDTKDLQIFYEVVQSKSTSKTAEKLGYVQSAISKRVTKLEEEIGLTLFTRSNKGMVLTQNGADFLKYAQQILTTVSDMEQHFHQKIATLRIGATPTISSNYLKKAYVNPHVTVYTFLISELFVRLKEGHVAIILTNRAYPSPEFHCLKQIREKIVWCYAAKRETLNMPTKIVVSRDPNCPYRLATLSTLTKKQEQSISLIEVDTLDVLLSLVSAGDALAVLPEKTVTSNKQLQADRTRSIGAVDLFVYKLKTNQTPIDLSFLS